MAPKPNPAEPSPSFEQALERLEAIVHDLEAGSLTLEQSLERYEEGVRLSRRLVKTLDEAEQRLERLAGEEDDAAPLPVELEPREAPAPPRPRRAAAATEPSGAGEDELPF